MEAPTTAPRFPLLYAAFGARHVGSQLPRIEEGFAHWGATEYTGVESCCVASQVDFVYANDAERWEEAANWRDANASKAKLILTVLDLALWNLPSGYNPYSLLPTLQRADAICSISRYVQSQLHRYYGLASTVIYQPIMNVTPDKRASGERPFPQYKVMMVGRLRDPSKRADLAVQALLMAGFTESDVAVVGSEPIGWGAYLGQASNETLNDLYNSVDYVMMCSIGEGLGLAGCESIAAGALPIVCHDLTTFHEPGFYLPHWGCYPNPQDIAYRLLTLEQNPDLKARELGYCMQKSESIRDMLSGASVARRILDVVMREKENRS